MQSDVLDGPAIDAVFVLADAMIDPLVDVMIDLEFELLILYPEAISVLTGMEIIAVATVVLDFAVSTSCSADVLADVVIGALTRAIFGALSDIGPNMLADDNANIFAVVMIALDFTDATPFGESRFFGWSAFGRWPVAVLDCFRALQAWMPSCHV